LLEPIEVEVKEVPVETIEIGGVMGRLELGEEGAVEGQLIGEFSGVGLLGSGPTPTERVFEEGTPVHLSTAGPAAGTLSQLRVFSEEGWVVGERMCFHTSFGARFDPPLAVCLDASEGRLRNPAVDVHDFGVGVVRPVSVRTTGALPELAVARALRKHRPDLRRCQNETLQRGLQSQGELELVLDVNAQGAVTQARLRSPKIESVTDCALTAAKGWTLPPTDDGKPAKIVLTVRLERR
jgi:hypothetical protein